MRVLFLAIVAATVASCSCAVWWETALIYQIYPRSFRDSNGDGIGDLNEPERSRSILPAGMTFTILQGVPPTQSPTQAGSVPPLERITEKLPFLKETGVDAIWMSPIFLSPMYDFGYDITDYRQIATEYGTMADFDKLLKEAKTLGMRIVLDYVPNHTSNESDWFIKSSNREAGYDDYYIWADGVNDTQGVLQPPNNWLSVFSKSAWEYNPTRGQYYLHQFVIGQPDLNYRSLSVQQEMKDVLSFWLDKGVSGFRIDAINFMYEVNPVNYGGKYPDEPRSNDPSTKPDDYEYLSHIYTKDLEETYGVVYDWKDLLDTYLLKDESKVMMTEAYADLASMIRYYGNDTRNGSMPFNFLYLGDLNKNTNAKDVKTVVDTWLTAMPVGKTANWVNGNHDQSRLATRHGVERVDSMNMIALLLPGLTITYQGEELGMTDGELTWAETVDPQACNTDDPVNGLLKSRDPARTPYHWDATKNAGFSNTNGSTWLPVASNYMTVNLAAEMAANNSHYKFYKDVVAIKKTAAVREGDLETTAVTDDVIVITRSLQNVSTIVAIANLGNTTEQINLNNLEFVPNYLKVVAIGVSCELEKGDIISKADIAAVAHCAIVFESTDQPPNSSVKVIPNIIASLILIIANQLT